MGLLRKNDFLTHIYFLESSCCTPELLNLFSSRYDPERLGFIRTLDIKKADILIINGYSSEIILNRLEKEYRELNKKPKVVAVGGCAISKGPLGSKKTKLPIAVFIPGCPPRPESIIDGITRGLGL